MFCILYQNRDQVENFSIWKISFGIIYVDLGDTYIIHHRWSAGKFREVENFINILYRRYNIQDMPVPVYYTENTASAENLPAGKFFGKFLKKAIDNTGYWSYYEATITKTQRQGGFMKYYFLIETDLFVFTSAGMEDLSKCFEAAHETVEKMRSRGRTIISYGVYDEDHIGEAEKRLS